MELTEKSSKSDFNTDSDPDYICSDSGFFLIFSYKIKVHLGITCGFP